MPPLRLLLPLRRMPSLRALLGRLSGRLPLLLALRLPWRLHSRRRVCGRGGCWGGDGTMAGAGGGLCLRVSFRHTVLRLVVSTAGGGLALGPTRLLQRRRRVLLGRARRWPHGPPPLRVCLLRWRRLRHLQNPGRRRAATRGSRGGSTLLRRSLRS